MMQPKRFLLGLTLFALLNLFVINWFLPRMAPEQFSGDVLFYLSEWGLAPGAHKGQGDSWTPMTVAWRHTQGESETLLYTAVFFEQQTKFQYPPTSLFLMWPVSQFPPDEYPYWVINGLNNISWGFLLLSAGLACAIFYLSWRRFVGAWSPQMWFALPLIFLLALTFYPNLRGYHIGQVQVWLNGLTAVVVLFWLLGWERAAGGIVGFMCLIKPQNGIIYLWGWARQRWPFVIAGTISGTLGVLLSLWLFGLANHLDYFPAVSFMSRHGEVFYPNQSVNGLLNRWFMTGPILGFTPNAFAEFHPVVYGGTLLTTLLFVAGALWPWGIHTAVRGHLPDLSIAIMTTTLASPIAWEHHYGVLLPIYAFILPYLLAQPVWGKLTLPALAFSYLLTSNFWILFHPLAETRGNILLSYLFGGALILLALLYTIRHTRATLPATAVSTP